MIPEEGGYVEVAAFPGVIWKIFEVTQINSVTLILYYCPEGWEPSREECFLFEILKSGELVDQEDLREPNPMEVLAAIHAQDG